jgi:hypothetical protein
VWVAFGVSSSRLAMPTKKRPRRTIPSTKFDQERYIEWRTHVAETPRRTMRFAGSCIIIGSFAMMLPILLHTLFPAWSPDPFAQRSDVVRLYGPAIVLTILVAVFAFFSRRRPFETSAEWLLRLCHGPLPLFSAITGIVMVLTGAADLQRQFGVGAYVATWVDSVSEKSRTSPAVVEGLILTMTFFAGMMLFLHLHSRFVLESSPLFTRTPGETTDASRRASSTPLGTSAAPTTRVTDPRIVDAVERLKLAWSRIVLQAIFMYAAIAASVYLYFVSGRDGYLHDPAAASTGMSAYILNLVIVFEGFRARWIGIRHQAVEATESETPTVLSQKIFRWSLTHGAVALVYVQLLRRGGLDKGADLLMNTVVPGLSRLEAFVMSSALGALALGLMGNQLSNYIDRLMKRRRRKKLGRDWIDLSRPRHSSECRKSQKSDG